MNKTIKIISIILMVSIMVLFLSTTVFAAGAVIDKLEADYEVEVQMDLQMLVNK